MPDPTPVNTVQWTSKPWPNFATYAYYQALENDERQYGPTGEYTQQLLGFFKDIYSRVEDAIANGQQTITRGDYTPYSGSSELASQVNSFIDGIFQGENEVNVTDVLANPNFATGLATFNSASRTYDFATGWNDLESVESLNTALDTYNEQAEAASMAAQGEAITDQTSSGTVDVDISETGIDPETPVGRWIDSLQGDVDELFAGSEGDPKARIAKTGLQAMLDAAEAWYETDAMQTTQAVVLKASGDLMQTVAGAVALIGDNPADTALHQLGTELAALGNDTYSEEFQTALADIDKRIADARGFEDTATAIFGALADHPIEFLVDKVGSEVLQEIPLLLASGGVSTAVRGVAALRGVAAEVAERIGKKVGFGTTITLDLGEAIFGSAGGAYEDALDSLQKEGIINPDTGEAYTLEEAEEAAQNVAIRNGLVGGLAAAASMGLGGNALVEYLRKNLPEGTPLEEASQSYLGDLVESVFENASDSVKRTLRDYLGEIGEGVGEVTEAILREGLGEGVEEGVVAADLEHQLYNLGDTDRDASGNITAGALLGALIGGPTGGTIVGGSIVANAVRNANPKVNEIMADADMAALGENADLAGIANTAQQQLIAIGIDQPKLQNDLLNEVNDAGYLTEGEVYEAATALGIELLPQQIEDFAGAGNELEHMQDLIKTVEQNIYGAPMDAEFDINNDGELTGQELVERNQAMEAWEESWDRAQESLNPDGDDFFADSPEGEENVAFVTEDELAELTAPGGIYEGWEAIPGLVTENGVVIAAPEGTTSGAPNPSVFDMDGDGSLSLEEMLIYATANQIFTEDFTNNAIEVTGVDPIPNDDYDGLEDPTITGDQDDYVRVGDFNAGVTALQNNVISLVDRLQQQGLTQQEALAAAIGAPAEGETAASGIYAELAGLATAQQVEAVQTVVDGIASTLGTTAEDVADIKAQFSDLVTYTQLVDELGTLRTNVEADVTRLLGLDENPDTGEPYTVQEAIEMAIGVAEDGTGEPTGLYADIAALPTDADIEGIVRDVIGVLEDEDGKPTGIFEDLLKMDLVTEKMLTDAIGVAPIYDEVTGELTNETALTGIYKHVATRNDLQNLRRDVEADVTRLLGLDENPDTGEPYTVQEAIEMAIGKEVGPDGDPTGLYAAIAALPNDIDIGRIETAIGDIKKDMLTSTDLAGLVTKDQLDTAFNTYIGNATDSTGIYEHLATKTELAALETNVVKQIKALLSTEINPVTNEPYTVQEAIEKAVGKEVGPDGNPTGLYADIAALPTTVEISAIKKVVDNIKDNMLTSTDLAGLVTKDQLDTAFNTYIGNATDGTGIYANLYTKAQLDTRLNEVRDETVGKIKALLFGPDAVEGLTVEEAIAQAIGVIEDTDGNPTGLYEAIANLPTSTDITNIKNVVDNIAKDMLVDTDLADLVTKTQLETALKDATKDLVTTEDIKDLVTQKQLNTALTGIKDKTVAEIKKYTDRPIKVRLKRPRDDRFIQNTLEDDLKDSHCLVTYNSVAACEAIINGTPAFTLGPNAAQQLAKHDLSEIENPYIPSDDEREAWLRHLSYSQFTRTEMNNGTAWGILNG